MLSVIGINETKKWDDLVKSFRTFDVHYLNGYAKAFELHGDGNHCSFTMSIMVPEE